MAKSAFRDHERPAIIGSRDEVRLAREAAAVRRAWAGLLGNYAWDVFVTLTLRSMVTVWAAANMFSKFIRRVERRAGRPAPWFFSIERGSLGDRRHVHALIAGTADLPVVRIEQCWNAGLSEVERYDPDLAAAAYVSKALEGDLAFYDIDSRRPPLRGIAVSRPSIRISTRFR